MSDSSTTGEHICCNLHYLLGVSRAHAVPLFFAIYLTAELDIESELIMMLMLIVNASSTN